MIRLPLSHLVLFNLTTFTLQAGEQLTLPLPDGGGSPQQPQAAVAGPDVVHVAFGICTAIYRTTSRNGGSRFTSVVKIADVPSLMLGARRGPSIPAIYEQAVVTAIVQGGELLSSRSGDGGRNWRGPLKVSDAPRRSGKGCMLWQQVLGGNSTACGLTCATEDPCCTVPVPPMGEPTGIATTCSTALPKETCASTATQILPSTEAAIST